MVFSTPSLSLICSLFRSQRQLGPRGVVLRRTVRISQWQKEKEGREGQIKGCEGKSQDLALSFNETPSQINLLLSGLQAKKKVLTAYQIFSKEYRLSILEEQPGLGQYVHTSLNEVAELIYL